MRVYATGMPRSGSRCFYSIVEDIVHQSDNLELCNKTGHGRQHKEWTADMHDAVVVTVVRDLRDVVVSAYPYILNHHKQTTYDPRQSTAIHPLYDLVSDVTEYEAYSNLIDEFLPDCYGFFLSYTNTGSYIFLYRHFFNDLYSSVRNLNHILRASAPIDPIVNNHTLDSRKDLNPHHVNDGKVDKWKTALRPEQEQRVRLEYPKFYTKFPSLS